MTRDPHDQAPARGLSHECRNAIVFVSLGGLVLGCVLGAGDLIFAAGAVLFCAMELRSVDRA